MFNHSHEWVSHFFCSLSMYFLFISCHLCLCCSQLFFGSGGGPGIFLYSSASCKFLYLKSSVTKVQTFITHVWLSLFYLLLVQSVGDGSASLLTLYLSPGSLSGKACFWNASFSEVMDVFETPYILEAWKHCCCPSCLYET